MDQPTHIVTEQQLLSVFLAGVLSGTGTTLIQVRPDLGLDRVSRIAKAQAHVMGHAAMRDPAVWEEMLVAVRASLADGGETSVWIKP